MVRIDLKPVVVFLTAGLVLLAGGTVGVTAQSTAGDETASTDAIEIGDQDIVIEDATVHITDTHLTGPGLPEKSIDEATFTVENSTVSTGGFVVTINGQDISVGHLSLTVDDVGVTLENVSMGESDND